MEWSCFLQITSKLNGTIKGEGYHNIYSDWIRVYKFNHELKVPIPDYSRSVGAGGEVAHLPIEIVKNIDKSTPLLYQSLIKRDELELSFKWLRFSEERVGVEEIYYELAIKRSKLIGISAFHSHADNRQLSEKLSFVYDEICWSAGKSGSVVFQTNWKGD